MKERTLDIVRSSVCMWGVRPYNRQRSERRHPSEKYRAFHGNERLWRACTSWRHRSGSGRWSRNLATSVSWWDVWPGPRERYRRFRYRAARRCHICCHICCCVRLGCSALPSTLERKQI